MKINWKVRFNKHNLTFWVRVIVAIFVPILTYFGLEAKDLTSWDIVGDVLLNALRTPWVWIFTILNVINIIPDPTTAGISDSEQALTYEEPKKEGE